MAAFRKFDPYTFLADQEEGGAPSEAAAEAPETLAALATLAGEHPQNENKGSEDEPGIDKSGATSAKAAKIAKADDDGMGTLATFANLAAAHSQTENERSGTTLAKAAKAANPSSADIRGAAEGLDADRTEPTPAKAAKPANPSGAVREREGTPPEPTLLAPGIWFNRFGPPGEPAFNQPCPSRRGLVERRGAMFLHFCASCGAWGAFGYGAVGDRPGRWYCREHLPKTTP
jgi:hypothetical protein